MARVQGRGLSQSLLLDPQGQLLVKVDGATVTIRQGSDPASALATVYAGETGGATVTQPLTSENGVVVVPGGGDWWLDPGVYWLHAALGGRVLDPLRIEAYSGVDSARLTSAERGLGRVTTATGDGATDDTAAFRADVAAARLLGTHVVLTPGTYRVSGRIHDTAQTSADVRLVAAIPGTVTIERTANTPIIDVAGSRGTAVALSANVAVGATSVTAATLPTSLAAGDFVTIRSNALLTPTGNAKLSETVQVTSVSGAGPYTINLTGPTEEAYLTADSAEIQRLTLAAGVRVSGIKFRQTAVNRDTSANPLMNLILTHKTKVEKVECADADVPGLSFNSCIDWDVVDYRCDNLTDDVANDRIGYGINVLNECRDWRIIRPSGRRVRHVFTTNADTSWGAPRHGMVVHGQGHESSGGSWNTHKEGKFISIVGCESHNDLNTGIYVRSPSTRVIDPLVVNPVGGGVRFAEGDAVDGELRGGTLVLRNPSQNTVGIGLESARCTVHGTVVDGLVANIDPVYVGAADSTIRGITFRNLTGRAHAIAYAASIGSNHVASGIVIDSSSTDRLVASIGASTTVRFIGEPTGTGIATATAYMTGSGTGIFDNPNRVFQPPGSYALTDRDYTVLGNSGTSRNLQLPLATGRQGREFMFIKTAAAAGEVYTVTVSGADTIAGAATYPLSTQWQWVRVRSIGTNRWIIVGSGTS